MAMTQVQSFLLFAKENKTADNISAVLVYLYFNKILIYLPWRFFCWKRADVFAVLGTVILGPKAA